MGMNASSTKKKVHWASCYMTQKVHAASTKPDDEFGIETVEAAPKEKLLEALAILKIKQQEKEGKVRHWCS